LLPFADDFAIFAKSFNAAMKLKKLTLALLKVVGLHIYPEKRYHTATQVGDRLG